MRDGTHHFPLCDGPHAATTTERTPLPRARGNVLARGTAQEDEPSKMAASPVGRPGWHPYVAGDGRMGTQVTDHLSFALPG